MEHILVAAHLACLLVEACRVSRPYGRKKGRSIAARPPPDGRPKATPPADPSRAAPRSPPHACPARPNTCRRAAPRHQVLVGVLATGLSLVAGFEAFALGGPSYLGLRLSLFVFLWHLGMLASFMGRDRP